MTKKRRSHKSGFRWLPFLHGGVVGSVLFAAVSGTYIWATFPDVRALKTSYPVVKYRGRDVPPEVILQKSRPKDWVGLYQISKLGIAAILISEDWAFFQHPGYDMNQIKEAVQEDWDRKSFARGASTIDQQVVRNVFLTKDKNVWRKIKELYLASRLDQAVGKRRVLETYFNIAEWGPGLFGIGQASSYYFHKPPSELNAKEGAFLAMLLPSPIRYAQSFRQAKLTDYASDTVQSILEKMTQAHYLSDEEKLAEWNRPLSFEANRSKSP